MCSSLGRTAPCAIYHCHSLTICICVTSLSIPSLKSVSSNFLRKTSTTRLYITPASHSTTFTKFKNSIVETDSFTLEELEELQKYIKDSIQRKESKRSTILKEQPLHDLCEISREACEIVSFISTLL